MLLRLHSFSKQTNKNVPVLTSGVVRMRQGSQTVLRDRVRTYIRCRENAFALHAPFILDPSGPTVYKSLKKLENMEFYGTLVKNSPFWA